VYWPLARLSRLLHKIGARRLAELFPLTLYRDCSFRIMRNDSLDRFGTRVEHRFSRAQVIAVMSKAGLRDIRVSPGSPFWHAIGLRA
jgi:hypothetical protein